jgi:hypothetical protein
VAASSKRLQIFQLRAALKEAATVRRICHDLTHKLSPILVIGLQEAPALKQYDGPIWGRESYPYK